MNTNSWKRVFDGANRRVRGLWLRNGSYAVQTTVLDASTGVKKVRRIPIEAGSLSEAKTAMTILLQTIGENGTIHGTQGQTLAEYRGHYILRCGKAPKTVKNENHFLIQWEKFLGPDCRISKITPTNILGYRHHCETKKLSNRTINLHVRALRAMLTMAQVEGYIRDLPMDQIKQLREVPEEKTRYSMADFFAIGTEALRCHPRTGEQVADWLTLAMYSGGRVSELLKLKWSNVDWTRRQLVFRAATAKSGQERRVNFNRNLFNHLMCMFNKLPPQAQDQYLFPSCRSDSETTTFRKTLNAIRDRLGFSDFSPHATRHHFISRCVMAGIDYLSIARWVGHKDGGVLIGKVYGHLNDSHLEDQANKI